MMRRFVLALCILGTAATSAAAQAGADTSVLRAASRFEPGDRIRVALMRNRWVGEFQSVRGDTLFFGPPGQPPMAIRFNAVDSIWRPQRGTTRGLAFGALAGGAAGAVASAIVGGSGADGRRHGNAALIGAGVGGVVGAFRGVSRRWRLVFPAAVGARR